MTRRKVRNHQSSRDYADLEFPNFRATVIVNTVCPGLVNTDLGRSVTKLSWTMQLFVPAYFSLLGKTADYGARTYLIAALTSENAHVRRIT